MAKAKISVTLDAAIVSCADEAAKAEGSNRSELCERALRHEVLMLRLRNYVERTVPALDIDAYAERIYRANPSVGQ